VIDHQHMYCAALNAQCFTGSSSRLKQVAP
jgi:hypothetical protein